MNFNRFAAYYNNITGNTITRDELNNQVSFIIQKVKAALDVSTHLKSITIRVIQSRMYYIQTGQQQHGITKQDYKNAIDVISKIAEKDIKDEQQKKNFKFWVEFLKSAIDNKPGM